MIQCRAQAPDPAVSLIPFYSVYYGPFADTCLLCYTLIWLQDKGQDGDKVILGDHWSVYGVISYVDKKNPKELWLVPRVFNYEKFMTELESSNNVWYIYWAILPE